MKRFFKIVLGIYFFPYGIYLIYQYYNKSKDNFDKKHSINESKQKQIQDQIDEYKKNIKIVDVSHIDDVISKNENTIIDYDKNKHHDLVRLSGFIKNLESKIKEQFEWGTSDDNIYSSELFAYVSLQKNTENLDLLVKLSVTMINKLVENKITDFLVIYEKFEVIGAFRSSFENELLDRLDNLTDKLDNISNQLRKIDGRLGYQNLVLTYNTYQFHKIRKSLKK